MAVIAGGILKAIFDKDGKIAAVLLIIIGAYMCVGTIIFAKSIDRKGKND